MPVVLTTYVTRTTKYNMDAMTELFEAIEAAIQELEAKKSGEVGNQPNPGMSAIPNVEGK